MYVDELMPGDAGLGWLRGEVVDACEPYWGCCGVFGSEALLSGRASGAARRLEGGDDDSWAAGLVE